MVFVRHIKGQPVGIEEAVLACFEHDLLNVVSFMNACRDVLQLFVKKRLKVIPTRSAAWDLTTELMMAKSYGNLPGTGLYVNCTQRCRNCICVPASAI